MANPNIAQTFIVLGALLAFILFPKEMTPNEKIMLASGGMSIVMLMGPVVGAEIVAIGIAIGCGSILWIAVTSGWGWLSLGIVMLAFVASVISVGFLMLVLALIYKIAGIES